MLVTPLPIVTLVKLLHPSNAAAPMLVTLFGMVMVVSFLQSKKAPSSMLVTLAGITTTEDLPLYSTNTPFAISKSDNGDALGFFSIGLSASIQPTFSTLLSLALSLCRGFLIP